MSPITMIWSLAGEGGEVAAGVDAGEFDAHPPPRTNMSPSNSAQPVGFLKEKITFTAAFNRFFAVRRCFSRFI